MISEDGESLCIKHFIILTLCVSSGSFERFEKQRVSTDGSALVMMCVAGARGCRSVGVSKRSTVPEPPPGSCVPMGGRRTERQPSRTRFIRSMGLYDQLRTIHSFIVMSVDSMTSETQPFAPSTFVPGDDHLGKINLASCRPGAHG